MTQEATIHIVDDDDGLRFALADLLNSVGYRVRSYNSAAMFLSNEHTDEAGCLVIDIRMPGASGLELQATIEKSRSPLPIIFMTGYGDVHMSVQAMKAGAVDFLEKPFRDQDMLEAISAALEKDRSRRAGGAQIDTLHKRLETLTLRERQVLSLICAGNLNKEAAGALGLSEVTIKAHRGAGMRKMGAKTVAELARMWTLLGL